MLTNNRTLLPAALLASVAACAPAVDAGRTVEPPLLLVASPESRVGGEAHYEGRLRVENGCVVVASQGRTAVPIFDPSVRLIDSGNGLIDVATGRRFRFGDRLSAAAAWLRDDGRGWSFADIEAAVGPLVPPRCGGENVVRLKRFEPVRPRPSTLPSQGEVSTRSPA